MKKTDWILIVLWLAFLIFVGPYLISAKSWELVILGFAIPIGLTFWSVHRLKQVVKEVSK